MQRKNITNKMVPKVSKFGNNNANSKNNHNNVLNE